MIRRMICCRQPNGRTNAAFWAHYCAQTRCPYSHMMEGGDTLPKHYGLKAQPVEIIADQTPRQALARSLRRAWETVRWNVARLLRLRWR